MRPEFEKIVKLATGFAGYEIKEGRLYFAKCTRQQTDFWYSEVKWLGERADTTTGIRIDFDTDSRHFRAAVSNHRFELKVNGVTVQKTEDGVLEAELSGSDRVTLVFPSHSVGSLEYIELDDGASMNARTHTRRLLFMGDSITQGYNSEYDSMSYAQRVTDFFDAESMINGIGGSYFAEGSFDTPPFDPDTVIVAYGCNDFGHYKTMDERLSHADAFLKKTADAYAGKRLFYILPIPRRDLDGDRQTEFDSMRDSFRAIAVGCGFTVIDGYLAIPDLADFYADNLHPNDLGFSTYADYVIKQIG